MDIYYDTGTKVKVTFLDNKTLVGTVDHWTPPSDSEDNLEELTIVPTEGKLKDRHVNFNESEVKTIEIIE